MGEIRMCEDLKYNQINGASNCIMYIQRKQANKQKTNRNYNHSKVITQIRRE